MERITRGSEQRMGPYGQIKNVKCQPRSTKDLDSALGFQGLGSRGSPGRGFT